MFNQKSIVLVFIDHSGITFFGGSLTEMVVVIVPETIIRDMEVLSKDGLYSLIKDWVKKYNLIGSQIVMIFSETMYFEKIFVQTEQSQVETDILIFFEMVPYESIWSKVYPEKGGKRAIAVSRAFYEGLHQGFLLQGLPTKAVIPSFVLGDFEKQHSLDHKLATHILENLDRLCKMSLLDTHESNVIRPEAPISISSDQGKKKSTLPMLLSVFGLLLLVLGIVVYLQYR